MKKIRIKGYICYDDELRHSDNDEDIKWFYDEVLKNGNLIVHANEEGDTVGDLVIEEKRIEEGD